MKPEKPRTEQSRSRRRMLVDLAVASGVIAQPGAPCAHAADTTDEKSLWTKVLELDHQREPVHGSAAALSDAIRKGADLRIGTPFRHNEHIDTTSRNNELIREHMDFRVTYLLDDRWSAGIETLRMPVSLPDGFGPRPSMSFFLYNQDGTQAVGRPFLDGQSPARGANASAPKNDPSMPRMRMLGAADEQTNAPSHHFIYAFDYFRFFACDRWREVLSHDERGQMLSGSLDDLTAAAHQGREIKVGIRGLCQDLGDGPAQEVFVHVGPCYHYTKSRFLIGATNPLVRVSGDSLGLPQPGLGLRLADRAHRRLRGPLAVRPVYAQVRQEHHPTRRALVRRRRSTPLTVLVDTEARTHLQPGIDEITMRRRPNILTVRS